LPGDKTLREGLRHQFLRAPCGKQFVAATIKVRDGEAAQFWRVLAFSDTVQSELLRLDDGDALAVQGVLRAEAYSKDGELRVGRLRFGWVGNFPHWRCRCPRARRHQVGNFPHEGRRVPCSYQCPAHRRLHD